MFQLQEEYNIDFLSDFMIDKKYDKKFKLLDIATADMSFEAFGKDLNELFENCALVVSEIMTDTSKVEVKKKINIELTANNLESLLFDFISEILFRKDTEGLVFSKFSVKISKTKNGYELSATLGGDVWNREKHEVRTEVKAATYNQMQITKNKKQWRAQMVLDV